MRMLLAAAVIVAAISPVQAADTPQQASMKSCAATWKTMTEADKAKTKYTDYMGTCMKKAPETAAAAPAGTMMMSAKPKADTAGSMMMAAKPKAAASGSMMMAAPTGGSAKCKDGTTVTYKNRQGTCSGHGGVATWQ